MRRLRHLMRKELLELRQDVKLFGILFVAPLVQLTFLGYAATTDVKNVPVVVADADRSVASRCNGSKARPTSRSWASSPA